MLLAPPPDSSADQGCLSVVEPEGEERVPVDHTFFPCSKFLGLQYSTKSVPIRNFINLAVGLLMSYRLKDKHDIVLFTFQRSHARFNQLQGSLIES